MATIEVKVPIAGNEKERIGWIENVSQYIDAGNDVKFVDSNGGANVEVSHVQLDADGTICIYGRGYTSAEAKALTLTGGGFHIIPGIHGIRAAGTSTSIGIHVKI
jgi:hypothetical protein